MATKEIYRVRSSFQDAKSQAGAYAELNNAIELAKQIGLNVYNSKGDQVYPDLQPKSHWAKEYMNNLIARGVKIFDERFDEPITRGEVFKLIDQAMSSLAPSTNVPHENYKGFEVEHPDRQTTIVRIPHESIESIDLVVANTTNKLETLSDMQRRTGLDLMINGGLFWYDNNKNMAHSLNLLFANSKQENEGQYSRFCLIVNKDESYKFDWYKWSKDRKHMLGGSPSLVIDGKIQIDKGNMNKDITEKRHPRSAIGINDTHLLLVTIDGRNPLLGLKGMTVTELASYMLELGCNNAINLDGGGSSKIMHGKDTLNKNKTNRKINNAIGINLS